MNKRIVLIACLILIASIFPNIIFTETIGYVPSWLSFVQLIVLMGACVVCFYVKDFNPLFKFAVILVAIKLGKMGEIYLASTTSWNSIFVGDSFVDHFGSSILLKLVMVIPVIVVLLLLVKSREAAYLSKGDLSVKASKIGFLGIKGDRYPWGKLSLISGFLIGTGTLLLTLITVTGFSVPEGLGQLVRFMPVILLLALVNSFCEGVVYRSTILGTLKDVLPKQSVLLVAAIFFGIAHYYGAPSGMTGVVMSGLLGWYMCRAMYETRGFAAAWFIHFIQDVVIFSTIFLLFGYAV
ncbi:MAG: CPBP family intramembrane metalloprotease [Bacillus sp. (in: Bacteria)]|nr:CPBP family intramembrane metalloprotease [Bacillus sp. (in: firmicutes)]